MKREDETHFDKAYRYISFFGLWETIESKSLRFTRITELNDPLDNSLFLLPLPSKGWKIIYNDALQLASVLKSYEKVTNRFYLCCFSKTYKHQNSYLMWSYYCNNHSEVCFEIDFAKHKLLGGPVLVHYAESLVRLRSQYAKKRKGFGPFFLTHKSSVWKHEQEVRLVIIHSEENQSQEKYKFINDNRHLSIPINLSIISKIIFGLKASEDNKHKTAMMFINRGYTPLFEEMFINPSNLKLEAKKYTIHLKKDE